MSSTADSTIRNLLNNASSNMKAAPRTEVGFVATVALNGVGQIAKVWQPLLINEGLSLKLTGVFCHAAPTIKFVNMKGLQIGCELADLLIVVDTTTSGGLVRQAALIQAKMAGRRKRVYLSGKSSVKQLKLFQNWPAFTFVDKAYPTKSFNLKQGVDSANSGSFGVIDRHLSSTSPEPVVWTQHTAIPEPHQITNEPRLGTFIAKMVAGTLGFGRLASPKINSEWSELVELLLNITYNRAFTHRASLGSATPNRGTTAIACLCSSTSEDVRQQIWGSSGGHPPHSVEVIEDDGTPKGISIMHIEIDEQT